MPIKEENINKYPQSIIRFRHWKCFLDLWWIYKLRINHRNPPVLCFHPACSHRWRAAAHTEELPSNFSRLNKSIEEKKKEVFLIRWLKLW